MSEREDGKLTGNMVSHIWKHRETNELVELGVHEIVHFLNRFDNSARYKLGKLNQRLSQLERHLEHVESRLYPDETVEENDQEKQ